jgi:type I restriction enzyme S subunit
MNKDKHIPQGYKDSPLGIIPKEWEVKKLGEVCNISVGRDVQVNHFSEFMTNVYKYPVYSNTIEEKGLYGYYNYEEYTKGKVTVVGRGVGLGTSFARDNGFGAIGRLVVLTPKENLSNHYLESYINNKVHFFVESAAIPQLTGEQIASYRIAIPSLPEQKEIEKYIQLWDTAIEKQSELVEKLKLRKRALMQQLFTGKKRLPGFSGEWKKRTYSSILTEVKRSLKWDEDELYKLISVRRRSEGLFFRESLYGRDIATKNLRPAKTGDFLISKMQIVHGASGLVTDEFDDAKISGSYISLISKDSNIFDIRYYNLWSQMPIFYHQTFVSSFGVHIEKMTFDLDTFMSFGMPLPPIDEQHAIVSLIESINKEIKLANEKLTNYQSQKRGLMQQLLTGKKRII